MKHQQGIPREQLQMLSFDSMISAENPVRFFDSFVDHLDLSKLNFQVQVQKAEGRPSFESKVFLKIYLYGYLNGLRSSRRLAKECKRNIELHWLLHSLTPNYHSICDFRKDNPDALRSTFKLFVSFLKEAELIGGETIAIDGTKSRASNSKKNNYANVICVADQILHWQMPIRKMFSPIKLGYYIFHFGIIMRRKSHDNSNTLKRNQQSI